MAKLQELALNRSGSRALLLIAIVAGLIAAVLVFMALQDSDDSGTVTAPPDTVKAVVAAQSIAPGTEITEEMLKVVDVPNDLVVSGSFATSTPLVGEVTNVQIASGEQITRVKLGAAVPDNTLSPVVPRGMRGVGVEVQEVTAVGGNLLTGDRVDILVAHRIKILDGVQLDDDAYILRTETVLQNVEVLSVAQETQKPAARLDDDAKSGEEAGPATYTSGVVEDVENQPAARTITVALTPAQSQEIVKWQDSETVERVWAVLRPYGDDEILEVEPVDMLVIRN